MSETNARVTLARVKAFMKDEDEASERLLARADEHFGHPAKWPFPPRTLPRWHQFRIRRRLKEVETWFGPLSQDDLDAFWTEMEKGQSVYEDAGGYVLRCYRALVALPVEEPYSYAQAVHDALRRTP